MQTRLTLLLAALLVVAGCSRSPSGGRFEDSEPEAPPPAPAAQATAPGQLPPGHPPAGNAAAQPVVPGMPANHPPMPGTGPHGGGALPPPVAGGLTWEAQAPFIRRPPASSMRVAEYVIPAEDGEDGEAVLAVFFFGPGQGGGVDANIDRWINQVDPPGDGAAKDAATVEKKTINDMPVTTVAIDGAYSGMSDTAVDGYRLLGAIAEGPQGAVFFKLTGPKPIVERGTEAFEAILGSVRSQGAPHGGEAEAG